MINNKFLNLIIELQSVSPKPEELGSKLEVMKQSVLKIENMLSEIRLREEELLNNPDLLKTVLKQGPSESQK